MCECYGHDNSIPDYQHEVSIPRTLQGYYAKSGGCPCCAKTHGPAATNVGCVCGEGNSATIPKNTYRAADGPHPVYPATSEDPQQFPNAKNYGGTVAQRGPTTIDSTARPRGPRAKLRAAERTEERAQDRKSFLKAVLRDEMLARMDAEAKRDALEQDTGLMASHHVVEYNAAMAGSGAANDGSGTTASYGPAKLPTVAEQHDEVMDELRYVASQPVGSKYNINRMYYLLEEEERINALRRQEKMAARSLKM